ncbi:hypothetical protein V3N99_13035 [Dermatophilaceae bacterium Soc4.6]
MTVAILLEPGLRAIEDAAPDLVRHVRSVHSGALTRAEQAELGRLAAEVVEAIGDSVRE